MIEVLQGDCREVMAGLEAASFDAVVTDPPYGLTFMGKDWDRAVPGEHFWAEALRVAKPGAHLVAFGGTRTFHRLACAIEDAGWEIRDTLCWLYGQGFPKSLDVSKALDKEAGAEREVVGERPLTGTARIIGVQGGATSGNPAAAYENGTMRDTLPITAPSTDLAKQWAGWGTAMKPGWEPVIWAHKPLTNVPQWCILAQDVQRKVCGLLCLLLSDARSVDALSRSSLPARAEEYGSALLIAAVLHGAGSDEWCGEMATYSSQEAVSTCLSIASSWSEFLGVLYSQESTSTTRTETDPTTALRTLNSCLSQLMPPCIMEAVCRLDGFVSNAPGAGSSSTDERASSDHTQRRTAAALASLHQAVTSASTVVESLLVAARVAASALSDATGRLDAQGHAGLAPSIEPIILARKPLCGTVAANVREHGCGALNIDGCRIEAGADYAEAGFGPRYGASSMPNMGGHQSRPWVASAVERGEPVKESRASEHGRFPANVVLTHTPECRCVGTRKVSCATTGARGRAGAGFGMGAVGGHDYADPDGMETVEAWECAPDCPVRMLDEQSGVSRSTDKPRRNSADAHNRTSSMGPTNRDWVTTGHSDTGGASRFFYTGKATRRDRGDGNTHPTVKPSALMEWLIRLVCPPGGRILDPFCGSGTTLVAAARLGFDAVGIELDPKWCEVSRQRVDRELGLFAEVS